MKSYAEYCPIAMGAEVVGDRWTPLVLRELIIGSTRFSDIHRGVPRMSRTLLSQRLRQLERSGLVDRTSGGEYVLTEAGRELEPVVWALGDWSMKWFFGDPGQEHLDGTHLMWRIRQRIDADALPEGRTVVQFDFLGARKGKRIWLLLDPAGSSVCERDEGFEADLVVQADILEVHRIWSGRSTWAAAEKAGLLAFTGPRPLVRAFPSWFLLSPFAGRPTAVGS